jgi:hypothetical protein
MLSYISIYEKATNKHAIGFIRLAFENNIGFNSCPYADVKIFDAKYGHHFP